MLRGIAVALLVPVRLLWEAVKLCGRAIAAACLFVLQKLLEPAVRFRWYWLVRPLWLFVKDVCSAAEPAPVTAAVSAPAASTAET